MHIAILVLLKICLYLLCDSVAHLLQADLDGAIFEIDDVLEILDLVAQVFDFIVIFHLLLEHLLERLESLHLLLDLLAVHLDFFVFFDNLCLVQATFLYEFYLQLVEFRLEVLKLLLKLLDLI